MARYELVEGTSSKFWDIALDGASFTTTYGKIGTAGKATTKSFASDAEAKKEHDKIVAEKVKKGYVPSGAPAAIVDGDGARGEDGPDRRNPELEAAIIADPGDEAAYQVYADWLSGQGDPRGELIALQMKHARGPAARALMDRYEAYFLGELHAHQQTHDGNEEPAFTWKNGFIHAAHLSYNSYADEDYEGRFRDVLTALLTHRSGRFLAELTLTFNGEPNDGLGDLVDALVAHPPATLRKLHIGDFEIRGEDTELSWYDVGDLSRVWALVPRLETLILQGGSFTLGTLDLPALRRADFITGGLSKASVHAIATAKWPRIQSLNIWFGDPNYGGDSTITDAQPLLGRADMRALRHLGLMNCGYTDELAAALPTSAILPQLSSLSFAKGVLSDDGARGIAAHKDAFAHLDTLDVSECLLTDAGVRVLKGCAQTIVNTEQRDIEEAPQDRYPAIGE